MPRHAIRPSIIALCLAACVVDPEDVDVEDRAAGDFCRRESVSPSSSDDAELEFCGGDGTQRCSDGFTCIDDPSDDCDPLDDGVDCFGICVEDEEAATCPDASCVPWRAAFCCDC